MVTQHPIIPNPPNTRVLKGKRRFVPRGIVAIRDGGRVGRKEEWSGRKAGEEEEGEEEVGGGRRGKGGRGEGGVESVYGFAYAVAPLMQVTSQSNPSCRPLPLAADVSWMDHVLFLMSASAKASDTWAAFRAPFRSCLFRENGGEDEREDERRRERRRECEG